MLRAAIVLFLLFAIPSWAQQQRPTAAQIMAQQLAAAFAQNAELIVREGQCTDRLEQLLKQRTDPPAIPKEGNQ